ncbi:carbohydrate ABC transporter permease [Virgibacillus oceani]|uniref:ABC transporter permease protein YurN n=1 Tax=Virgibacillus oceani TaxID=1479511 RepID=A0A917M2D8_9BACI|nr:sugar ABC transporter permease [Virgibacillus oceani]GGG72823.1 putative ABC transporter permease protein YurN [Virgibacillus oceani]
MKKLSAINRSDKKTAFLMLLPLIGLLTAFVIIPLFYAVFVSFYKWNFYQENIFIGFENYRRVLSDPLFYKAMWTGLKFAAIVIPAQFILAFLFANLIRTLGGKFGGFVKTSIYIPHVISGVVASIIFLFIYDFDGGLANFIITSLGLEQVAWLADVKFALTSISIPAIWLGFGLTTLVMLAGLNDIPKTYYEAAVIDGANAWHKMIYITIPLLKNIFLYLLVVGVTGAIQQFDLPYLMTGGGPLNETMTPNLFIFTHFTKDPYMGYTVASALLLFVILAVISAVIFKLFNSKKMDS